MVAGKSASHGDGRNKRERRHVVLREKSDARKHAPRRMNMRLVSRQRANITLRNATG